MEADQIVEAVGELQSVVVDVAAVLAYAVGFCAGIGVWWGVLAGADRPYFVGKERTRSSDDE